VDLALFARVAWRFRVLVTFGLALAFALAFLSFVKIDVSNHFQLTYRENEQWESLSTLFVQTPGLSLSSTSPSTADPATAQIQADASARAISLAALYLQLATTDPILKLMERSGKIDGIVRTFPVTSTGDSGGEPLPMKTFSAVAPSAGQSQRLARRHVKAFLDFLAADQARRNVAPEDRVNVAVVRAPQRPALLQPRKKTRPIVVFLTVAIATIGLAFILENMRPRVRVVQSQGGQQPQQRTRRATMQSKRSRRSA
jgi:hypothetical protein